MQTKDKPAAPIIGADGNIFNLMGVSMNALRDNGQKEKANELCERIMKCGSYEQALNIMCEYVRPVPATQRRK